MMTSGGSSREKLVRLTLYATRLKNVAGTFGISDPYAVVTVLANSASEKPVVLGQTEVLKNCLSPTWTKTFDVPYVFGKPTRVNVGIYDEIRKAKSNKSMGSATFELGEVLGSRGNIKAKKLKNSGTVFIRVEKAPERDGGTLHLKIRGVKLRNVDGLFGKSDPFYEVSRLVHNPGGKAFQIVHRSEVVMNDLNPRWEPLSVGLNEICGRDNDGSIGVDMDQPIRIAVFDWDKKGKHSPMGVIETSVNGLVAAKTAGAATCDVKKVDLTKALKLVHRGKTFGHLVVTTATVSDPSHSSSLGITTPSSTSVPVPATMNTTTTTSSSSSPVLPPPMMPPPPPQASNAFPKPSFIDYLSGGLEIQLSVGIDFTGSNGDPRKPGTLHHIHPDGQLNDYEKAITALGSVVARYDSDQKFSVLGFGAKFGGVPNHCFQLGPSPEADGIAGILEAYRGIFARGMIMSGPTVFAEIIQLVAAQARSRQTHCQRAGGQAYTILLILTDGSVSDINLTRDAIRAASDAPLSIVIIGIGRADFRAMEFLDDFSQQDGSRDICQFVEFERHRHNKISLTQATLDEIPDQLVEYFHARGIRPLPPVRGSNASITADEYNEDEDIDLTLDFQDGEIVLGPGVGYHDDTGYGNYSQYAGVTVMAPPPVPPQPVGAFPPPTAPPPQQQHQQQHQQSQPFFPPPQPHVPTAYTNAAPGITPSSQHSQHQMYGVNGGGGASASVLGSFTMPTQPQHHSFPSSHHLPTGTAPQPSSSAPPPPPPSCPLSPNLQSSLTVQATPVQAATVAPANIFLVQVPQGVVAGQQIQIHSPSTGQPMIIAVPPGVQPGQTFPVSY